MHPGSVQCQSKSVTVDSPAVNVNSAAPVTFFLSQLEVGDLVVYSAGVGAG